MILFYFLHRGSILCYFPTSFVHKSRKFPFLLKEYNNNNNELYLHDHNNTALQKRRKHDRIGVTEFLKLSIKNILYTYKKIAKHCKALPILQRD